MAQEAEDARCYRNDIIKTPQGISEGPPRGGLSFCADYVAVHAPVFGAKNV
jgi:hypothetical protein